MPLLAGRSSRPKSRSRSPTRRAVTHREQRGRSRLRRRQGTRLVLSRSARSRSRSRSQSRSRRSTRSASRQSSSSSPSRKDRRQQASPSRRRKYGAKLKFRGAGELEEGEEDHQHQNNNLLLDGRSDGPESLTLRASTEFKMPNWRKDTGNIVLLTVLYMLQGIPVGLVFGTIPFLLQERHSLTDIGFFGLAGYPYSLKFLWSPVVDSVYNERIGRRKSWILPMQTGMGLVFIYLSYYVESLLGGVSMLTATFFVLILMVATQDIAVDGWALTMLAKENLAYASPCQSTGITIGYFSSFTLFLALNSPEFANTYVRSAEAASAEPLITLPGFLFFWGVFYLALTLFLWLLRTERRAHSREELPSVAGVYHQIWDVLRLPAMRSYVIILLTVKLALVLNDNALALKLIERGLKKEKLALLAVFQFPAEIFFTVFASRRASVDQPLGPWFNAWTVRLGLTVLGPIMMYFLPPKDEIGMGVYAAVLVVSLASSAASTFMFTSQGVFFNRISDPAIGGTYLTLLNTLSNFGGKWPQLVVLKMVDWLTTTACLVDAQPVAQMPCSIKDDASTTPCGEQGGVCSVVTDGYYVMALVSLLVGLAMYSPLRKRIERLQEYPIPTWHVASRAKDSRQRKEELEELI